MAKVDESFRTLYCDPGEDFGWVLGRGTTLLGGGTEKMWAFADEVYDAVLGDEMSYLTMPDIGGFLLDSAADEEERPESECQIGRIVCEDWRLYPWELENMGWDQCRTARVIGALTLTARKADIPLVLQGANIKPSAVAAGAEELYWHPLHENRHQNDALQHYVFFTCTQLMNIKLPILGQGPK